MKTEIEKLWDMVNACETVDECNKAEKAVRTAKISNHDFDELMMAITFIYREARHR